MGFYIGAVGAGVAGVAMIVAAFLFARHRRRFLARATKTMGIVAELDTAGSGEWPIVTFTPEGEPAVGGKVIRFRSSYTSNDYKVGQPIQVLYDPANPEDATIMGRDSARTVQMALGFSGVMMLPVAVMLGVILAPMVVARDAAVDAFLAAVRSDDPERVRRTTVKNAVLDEAYLRAEVSKSRDFDSSSSTIGFDDTSCIYGYLDGGAELEMRLAKVDGEWKVIAAAPAVPACAGAYDD